MNRDPLAADFVALLTATLATGLLAVASGSWRAISIQALTALPGWIWLGGLLGACHGVISMRAIPIISVTVFLVLVIAGNLLGAAIYDHFGVRSRRKAVRHGAPRVIADRVGRHPRRGRGIGIGSYMIEDEPLDLAAGLEDNPGLLDARLRDEGAAVSLPIEEVVAFDLYAVTADGFENLSRHTPLETNRVAAGA